MIILPDKTIKIPQLNNEIAALGIAGFLGAARLSRDADGSIVAPYILVKYSQPLTATQETRIRQAVADHVPIADPPPRDFKAELRAATSVDDLKAWLEDRLGG